MKRYEAFLIRYEMGMRKNGYKSEADTIKHCREEFHLFCNEPDLTDEEIDELVEEVKETTQILKERAANGLENSSRD